jgi:hypothetical protein
MKETVLASSEKPLSSSEKPLAVLPLLILLTFVTSARA